MEGLKKVCEISDITEKGLSKEIEGKELLLVVRSFSELDKEIEHNGRRVFDVERRPNGDFFIYTFYWDDMGEKHWCANSITETELRRIAEGIKRLLE